MKSPDDLEQYIRSQWDATVRSHVHAPHIVTVPVPHTVPSSAGNFNVLFYWDTFFTNLGLLRSERTDLAQSNCDALLWWIDQKGFVPNSAFVGDDNRSQPPLLSAMVRDVYKITDDILWLRKAYPRLVKEYSFWRKRRSFPDGLAHFGHDADPGYLETFYNQALHQRLRMSLENTVSFKIEIAGQLLAEAESGQDFTPLYQQRALEVADVKLNSILYDFETNLADFASILGDSEASQWRARADARAGEMQRSLWDESTGLFRGRNSVKRQSLPIASLECFYPLWAGMATDRQAKQTRDNLARFEERWGLAQTENYDGSGYQWAYPNAWPPSQWIAAEGLHRYGFDSDAERIAKKYCDAQCAMFTEYGHLWEKYDARTAQPAHHEYAADPMLGWTAGVFLGMKKLLG
jgi:alpha,alpha-trehalase